jgi:hypothetical protein
MRRNDYVLFITRIDSKGLISFPLFAFSLFIRFYLGEMNTRE